MKTHVQCIHYPSEVCTPRAYCPRAKIFVKRDGTAGDCPVDAFELSADAPLVTEPPAAPEPTAPVSGNRKVPEAFMRGPVWTADDDAVLREFAHEGSVAIADRLGRTKKAVGVRAAKLGISLRKSPPVPGPAAPFPSKDQMQSAIGGLRESVAGLAVAAGVATPTGGGIVSAPEPVPPVSPTEPEPQVLDVPCDEPCGLAKEAASGYAPEPDCDACGAPDEKPYETVDETRARHGLPPLPKLKTLTVDVSALINRALIRGLADDLLDARLDAMKRDVAGKWTRAGREAVIDAAMPGILFAARMGARP